MDSPHETPEQQFARLHAKIDALNVLFDSLIRTMGRETLERVSEEFHAVIDSHPAQAIGSQAFHQALKEEMSELAGGLTGWLSVWPAVRPVQLPPAERLQ